MTDYILRPWQNQDKPQLKALWVTAFGDPEEYIDTFFRCFLKKDRCIVAECDGKVVSAMYILGENTAYPYRRNMLSAGYTYALATLPEYRGRGIGRAVYQAATAKVLETHDMALVLPAEESLYPFYEKATGASLMSIAKEAELTPADLAGIKPVNAARISAFVYFGMRESYLSGMPHVSYTDDMVDFMEEWFEPNGDFFMTEQGIAAVETENGVCHIRELLCPDTDGMAVIAGVAAYHKADRYIVRSPYFFDGPGRKRPFMLGVLKEQPEYPMPFDLWWGFGLD